MTESKVRLNEFDASIGLDRGASKMKEFFWYLCKILLIQSSLPVPGFVKIAVLKMFGAHVGKRVVIKPRVNIHFPWKLIIGDNVWIGEEVFILNFELIRIGDNVCISQRAFLCGGNHDFRVPSMPYKNDSINLLDGCWIGANVFVGPGVTVGIDTVVVAGSIVSSNLEANGIYRGNPAIKIKNRWKI